MRYLLISLLLFFFASPTEAQKTQLKESAPDAHYASVKWRNIGPFRGGRSCAVTGVEGKPNLYYLAQQVEAFGKPQMGGSLGKTSRMATLVAL